MVLHKKTIFIVVVLIAVVLSAWVLASPQLVEHRSVLSGHVLSTVNPGTQVSEGTVLVTVGTLTGPIPAARATADGVVKEVLVGIGDIIRQGDLVVRIEPTRK